MVRFFPWCRGESHFWGVDDWWRPCKSGCVLNDRFLFFFRRYRWWRPYKSRWSLFSCDDTADNFSFPNCSVGMSSEWWLSATLCTELPDDEDESTRLFPFFFFFFLFSFLSLAFAKLSTPYRFNTRSVYVPLFKETFHLATLSDKSPRSSEPLAP